MNETTEHNNSSCAFENELECFGDDLMQKYEMPIIVIIKHLQDQNGMKHKDFTQYRRYCSRKLHRLRALLKVKCGRNKFQKSYVESIKDCRDIRHLLILVLLIERCWSYGNELGTVENDTLRVNGKMNKRSRLHGIRKLRKGCLISDLLMKTAQLRCTSRTIVEIQAYQSYISGIYHLKCSNWERSVFELKKSLNLCNQLKLDNVSLISDQSNALSTFNIPLLSRSDLVKLYDNHISELVPLIRLSLYHCKRLGIVFPEDKNIDKPQDISFVEGDSNMRITYYNRSCSVPAPVFEMPLVELKESYLKVKELIPINEKMETFNYCSESIIDCYSETLILSSLLSSKINEEIANITASTGVSPLSDMNSEDWSTFELFSREFNLFLPVERDMILLLQLLEYFSKPEYKINQIFSDLDHENYINSNDKKTKIRYPEEGIRVCDLLSFSISEIKSSNSIYSNASKLIGLLTHIIRNCRSMFLSQFYGQNGKFQEAYLLCDLVKSRTEIRETDYTAIIRDENGYVERIISLVKIINNILSDMVRDLFNIYLSRVVSMESSTPPKIGIDGERIIQDILDGETLRPYLMPIPVKPIMFDVAFDFIVPPDISSKMRKNGIVNRIFSKASRKFGIFK